MLGIIWARASLYICKYMQTNARKQRVLYFIRYIVVFFLLVCDESSRKRIDEHFYRDIRLRALNIFFFFRSFPLAYLYRTSLLELFITITRINDGRDRFIYFRKTRYCIL